MEQLEKYLGYQFKNRDLLKQALTHSSINHDISKNYERLEFLGDRVLGLAVAHLLYVTFPNEPEGNLSPRHMRLVCRDAVAEVSMKLHLNEYIKSEDPQLQKNRHILCDVGEAVIGAICMDAGIDRALEYVLQHWDYLLNRNSEPQRDYKSLLQELAHKLKCGTPVYRMTGREGSDHAPCFYVEVTIDGYESVAGSGTNKKSAEQDAAEKLYRVLQKDAESNARTK